MKVALVYDRVNKWGGAERVLLSLHKLFPDAPLYTSVYNQDTASWADVFTVKPSFLQKFPFIAKHHELFPFLMPLAFESFNFDEYDLVISVTSEAAKGIITKPGTKHICYCLTPTRYLWSGYNDYFKNPILRFLARPIISYLRQWDRQAAMRPDEIVGISEEVSCRIKKYYNRDASVIYPALTLSKNERIEKTVYGDFFLIVSRLSHFTKYKKIDLAIKACNKLKVPLKIIGTGNWESELKSIAGPTVEFLGKVSDKELKKYYASCTALLFPGVEDFGLTILEAQSFGKPVIAFRGGGALETIVEGKTGLFFDKQQVSSLSSVIASFEAQTFDPEDCRTQSQKFGQAQFEKHFLSLVNKYVY